jgi:hypothetical protein
MGRRKPSGALRRHASALALIGAASLAAPAWADAGGGSQGWSGQQTLTIDVEGHISESCTLGKIHEIDLGDLTRPNVTATVLMPLSCNVPFDLVITSDNGGLQNDKHPHGDGNLKGLLPYHLSLDIPVLTPASADVQGAFSSADMRAGTNLSSGDGVAFDGANITVNVDPLTGMPVAGKYSDTVELEIEPKV